MPTTTEGVTRARQVIGLCLLLALSACGSAPTAKSPDGSVSGPVTDVTRLLPLEHNSVFSYVSTTEDGRKGVYVIEISRPRASMAELKVAGRVVRRYISSDGVQTTDGGFVLRSPLKENSEWQGEFGKVKVVELARTVAVPAGTFNNCLETREQLETPAFKKEADAVYCPGIGLVFYKLDGAENGVEISEQLELKSFGPRYVTGM